METSFSELLERIEALGGQPPHGTDHRSLLHAYIACLSFKDLCRAIAMTLDRPADIRLALRSRLLRFLRETCSANDRATLETLVEQTAEASDEDRPLRQAVDALHSALFAYLALPTQQMLLERWVDRGTRGTMARWLKVSKEHSGLFDAQVALAYWRSSRDSRAAKSLAYQAPPETLTSILLELVHGCDEGWIIAKAIIRAGSADEAVWELIEERHPATFLYLCAQMNRTLNDDEAFELVYRCSGLAVEGDRGLAIWAVGQMGMVGVLDRVHEAMETLHERDVAELLNRHTYVTPPERLPRFSSDR
jgi:hypothetical protein